MARKNLPKANKELKKDLAIPAVSETKSAIKLPVRPSILYIIVILILVLGMFLWKNKALIVVATVDNRPIWRWDLDNKLINSPTGKQVYDDMINRQIVSNEAAKKGITVSDAEVNTKTSEIEKTLPPGVKLSDALAQRGMTMLDFRSQVRLQLVIEKLTAGSTSVTDEEITAYIEKNKESMTATTDAGLKNEAKQILSSDKLNQTFQKLFADLKKNAKVQKFL